MSKAILVMDMPSGCIKCPLYDYVPSSCFLTNKFQNNIGEDFKPDWCPLRELPQKKKANTNTTAYDKAVQIGYNTCIDEILKEGAE